MPKTLLEAIAHLPPEVQELVLTEAPHGWPMGDIPGDLAAILGDPRTYYVDLGFEDWPDASTQYRVATRAMAGIGVGIPGTEYRLRNAPGIPELVIEPRDGSETVELPRDWLSYIQVSDMRRPSNVDAIIWFGRQVRPDRRAPDADNFADDGRGWRRLHG